MFLYTTTAKQHDFLTSIEGCPGINTHVLHSVIGQEYTRRGVQFTYETVKRMMRRCRTRRCPLVVTGPSNNGRGAGLYSTRQIADAIEAFAKGC